MIKFKLKLDVLESTEDNISKVIIDISDISPHGNILTIDFNENLPIELPQEDFIKFTLIGKHISNIISRQVELAIIDRNNRLKEAEELLNNEVIESDEKRISELDLIMKIIKNHSIKGYLYKVITNNEELSKSEISKFTYTFLNSIIVQGPKKAKELKFEDMNDLEYELYFSNMIIHRKDGEFSLSDNDEIDTKVDEN